MVTPLRMLILDRPADTDLIVKALGQAGFEPSWQCVQTEADYLSHLHGDLMVILAESTLPQLSALRALDVLRQRGLDIPFIVVTRRMREEQVVACLKQGATDYVLKDRLVRLGPVVMQALSDKEQRDARPQAESTQLDSEAALRASEVRFQLLLSQNVDGVVVVGQDGIIQFVNPAAEALFARPAVDMVSEPFGFPVVVGETTELDIVCRGSDIIVVEMRVVETEWEAEPAWLVSLRDISERKRTEEMLRQSQKMEVVGTLAGGIAHDFNNILAIMMSFTQVAMTKERQQEPIQSYLQEVLTAATRGKDLVQQILLFSRCHSPERVLLPLHQLVREMLTLLRAWLPSTISVQSTVNTTADWVLANSTELRQVIMSLCSNAEYAMREAGGILELGLDTVDLTPDFIAQHPELECGLHVRLAIRDTGPGIAPAHLSRIFEPFFTTKGVDEGTGMGLAVAHAIVSGHNGLITVRSCPETGATFEIYLPRQASQITLSGVTSDQTLR